MKGKKLGRLLEQEVVDILNLVDLTQCLCSFRLIIDNIELQGNLNRSLRSERAGYAPTQAQPTLRFLRRRTIQLALT